MSGLVGHVRGLWGRYWFLPAIPAAYMLAMLAIGDLRPEHVIVALISVFFAYWGPRTKSFFVDAWPYVAVGIGYDLVRYLRVPFVSPGRVTACGLRDAELALFSVAPGVTFQDWFASHHLPALDLLFSVPYAIFAYVAIIYAGYLYFADRPRMRVYLFAFMIANYISFATWLLFPAAPPWYVRAHGCGIDMSVTPSAAALLRVDQLLHIDYFERFYSRTASVFGAMPSMHCAYPMLGLLTAWKAASWKTRPLHILYVALMFSAAVYLDHHWILDALAGWLLAGAAVVLAKLLVKRLGQQPAADSAASSGGPLPVPAD